TARDLADADPRRRAGGRADRVRAPFLAAAHGQALPGGERERAGQVTGHAERDRGGVVGQRLDAFDREPVKVRTANSVPWSRVHWGFCHRALTPSKGSPHALQRCSDLQAVALNWAVSRVSGEPQRGQRADGARPSLSGTGPLRRGAAEGGAMPP